MAPVRLNRRMSRRRNNTNAKTSSSSAIFNLVSRVLDYRHLGQSRSQRLRSFWSAPRKQDLWANQCQNPAIRNLIGLLYFTGSLFESEVSKTGNMERHQKLGEAKNAIEMPSNVHSIFCSEKTRKDNKCT